MHRSKRVPLFDHLGGAGEHRGRHGEVKHPGVFRLMTRSSLLDCTTRQVRQLSAVQHASCVNAHLTIGVYTAEVAMPQADSRT